MNIPNSITLFRIFLVIVFAAAASLSTYVPVGMYTVALIAFIIATISDWVDGYLARKLHQVTNFGKLMDPLADKILVCTTFVYLSYENMVPVWITAIIISREFLVTGVRQVAVEHGTVIAADNWGKWKTTFQLAFCIDSLIVLMMNESPATTIIGEFFTNLSATNGVCYHVTLFGAVALTAWSGINYTWKARHLLFKQL